MAAGMRRGVGEVGERGAGAPRVRRLQECGPSRRTPLLGLLNRRMCLLLRPPGERCQRGCPPCPFPCSAGGGTGHVSKSMRMHAACILCIGGNLPRQVRLESLDRCRERKRDQRGPAAARISMLSPGHTFSPHQRSIHCADHPLSPSHFQSQRGSLRWPWLQAAARGCRLEKARYRFACKLRERGGEEIR